MVDSFNTDRDVHISTRFGVGVTDEEWLRHRFMLFEAITAPSLRAQSYQNFVWNIFIGEHPVPWVESKLLKITDGIGKRVLIHKSAQSAKALNKVFNEPSGRQKRALFLIDDDDAWHINYISNSLKEFSLLTPSPDKVCFTFPHGFEWLLVDTVDLDAFNLKNLKIIRPASIRKYERPFLTMSCGFIFEGDIHADFGSAHSTRGQALADVGYTLVESSCSEPKWLYVRHKQADSALVKASSQTVAKLDMNYLVREFGIDNERVAKYQQQESDFKYGIKRAHGLDDKSSMLVDLDLSGDFTRATVYYTKLDVVSVIIDEEKSLIKIDYDGDANLRVAVYSDSAKKFVELVELSDDGQFRFEVSSNLYVFSDLSFRVQEQESSDDKSKWRNRTKLLRFTPI